MGLLLIKPAEMMLFYTGADTRCCARIEFPLEPWYNCYTSCDSTSTREKAGG